MRRSYPDAPFLSRCNATRPHLGPSRASRLGPAGGHTSARVAPRVETLTVRCPGIPSTSPLPRKYSPDARQNPTHQARTPHSCGWLLPPADTKRARTARSGRATKSAQALGRLPWFAPFLRRSRRLRPRFDMSFSLGMLSRLKHFCTHRPKPPRHRPFAATKVTEKRAAAQASSAHVTPRGRALSQRA